MHDSMVPNDLYYTSTIGRPSWSNPSQNLSPDFDIVLGSSKGGWDLSVPEVDRPKHSGRFLADAADGLLYQVLAGYGMAAGTAPILAGRRIRAASDGTVFAVEVLPYSIGSSLIVVERVYFLSRTPGEKLYVKVYTTDAQTTLEASEEMDSLGQFVEVWYTDNGAAGIYKGKLSDETNGAATRCFSLEMYLLQGSYVFADAKPAVAASTAGGAPQITFEPVEVQPQAVVAAQPQSVMSRFVKRMSVAKPNAKITTFVPTAPILRPGVQMAPLPANRPPQK